MFYKKVKNKDQIIDVVTYYEKDLSSPEVISKRLKLDLYDVFKITFNYRFMFKCLDDMSDTDLWELLKEVPNGDEKLHTYHA